MRDLSSPSWVIPRFLGKRVIKGNLALTNDFGVVPGAMKSGRSRRALSAVILVRYPLLNGTSGIVRESSISAYEFSSLVTSGGLPTVWRRMRDLYPR